MSSMEHDQEHGRTAADGLDEIREGGVKILAIIRQRLSEAQDFIDSGEFDRAQDRAAEASAKLGALAHAEMALGQLCHTHIIRAKDIPEGAVMNDGSVVTGREEKVCGVGPTQHLHVTLKWEDGEHRYDGDQELLVRSLPDD